jgi:RNA polymerase sigma-70 factor (ECF subfamily)
MVMTDASEATLATGATTAADATAVVVRAARGDGDARAALVEAHYDACMRYAERMLRDRADAEDVVQDTFLRAFRALGRYDPARPFRPWLFRILVNQCRTAAQRRRRRLRWFARDEAALRDARAPEWGSTVDYDIVVAAVEALEPLMREAFLLKFVEQLEYTEMATITGASVSALKMRVKRACDALRPRLEAVYRA